MSGVIAVAVDGSPASEAALAQAVGRARHEGRPLLGIFVLDAGWVDFIGNDWQSSKASRQGFLDYVEGELRAQGEQARRQFELATRGMKDARFTVIAGDPEEALVMLVESGQAELLVAGRETFRVCGRPSIQALPRALARRLKERVLVI